MPEWRFAGKQIESVPATLWALLQLPMIAG
jgi:hypothetical protein